MSARAVSGIVFATALFAAPALFALASWVLSLAGEYAARFSQVGVIGMLLVLPSWFTAFAWLAWRAAKRGEGGMRPYVLASLAANVASAVFYPAAIGLAAMTGIYAQAVRSASEGGDVPFEAPAPLDAALFAGLAAFFIGLFFLPMLAALFGWVANRLGMTRA